MKLEFFEVSSQTKDSFQLKLGLPKCSLDDIKLHFVIDIADEVSISSYLLSSQFDIHETIKNTYVTVTCNDFKFPDELNFDQITNFSKIKISGDYDGGNHFSFNVPVQVETDSDSLNIVILSPIG